MAPEQARGLPVDARSDLFSLGSVLYRLCTGELPFNGPDTLAILTALAVELPRPVYQLNPDVSPALANLVMSLLAKDPNDRPASARAVCEAIAAIQRDQAGVEILGFDLTQLLLEGEAAPEPEETEEPEEPAPAAREADSAPCLPLDQMSRLTGHRLGRYVLGEVLGRGHHGVVFRARDRNSGEAVALKVLSPDFPHNEKEVQRFSQVLTKWMTLQHPHLVAVHGAGRNGPYCWIALELVEGESLARVIERFGSGPRDWKRAFRVALHIGRTLQFTSGQRVVHSNITPQNILVRSADETFKLNDAMLSKVLHQSMLYRNALDQKLEAEADYLSPEQVDGGTSFVDHLCDLYSLGVVLYVMVTGQPLYRGETMEETLELIRAGAPTRPRKYQKSIPREFERTIVKMLARRQEERYQNPTELLADLHRIAVLYRIST